RRLVAPGGPAALDAARRRPAGHAGRGVRRDRRRPARRALAAADGGRGQERRQGLPWPAPLEPAARAGPGALVSRRERAMSARTVSEALAVRSEEHTSELQSRSE